MKIAFDFGGVLDINDDTFKIALLLQKAGAEIHLITAVVDAEERRVRETDHLRQLSSWGLDIPLERVHVVVDTELRAKGISHGKAKVTAMFESKCAVIFDDADGVVKEVQRNGFLALQVKKGGR